MEASLRNPYFNYWGKARPVDGAAEFHLLPYHCLDVAAVGQVYLRRSPALLAWLSDSLGFADQAALRGWISFWLALHDLGKFSISFQGQRGDLVERLQGHLPRAVGLAGVRHDSLGMQLWRDHIEPIALEESWFGTDPDLFDGIQCWARAVTGHHGQPPLSHVDHLGTHFQPQDLEAASVFVNAMRVMLLSPESAAVPSRVGAEKFLRGSAQVSWWVAGLAVLADWIGSNAAIFKYRDVQGSSLTDYWSEALALAEEGLDQSGVLYTKRQQPRSFRQLFPAISDPSPLQAWAASVDLPSGPQIHFLEDVTGAGKTEAAVMLTHRLMADGCADGFFVGLPTMATANAMYERIAGVYGELFVGPANLVLAHGRKNLVEDFAASVIEPGQDEYDLNRPAF